MSTMKRLMCLCAVLIQVSSISVNKNEYDSSKAASRQKRQNDDRWIWGSVPSSVPYDDRLTQKIREDDTPTSTSEAPTPCDYDRNPPVPNFAAPGRRVSEVKCAEYIYDIKARAEMEIKFAACKEYNKQNGIDFVSVIGGRDANGGEFPHMAAIGWAAAQGKWIFKCGGTLISNKFVLSAAHCTKASDRDTSIADVVPKIARLGDNNINDDVFSTDGNIIRIIAHPEYKPPKKYFDIALFELEYEMGFSAKVQPACLYTGRDSQLMGKVAWVTGWGVVDTATRATSPKLQTAAVDFLNFQHCDALLTPSCNRHWCGMQQHQLCAGKLEGGIDACQGDSGGPLQMNITLPPNTKGVMYHIVGVTSFGIGCGLPDLPGIYTKVSSFLDWIENIVWT